MGLLDKIDKKQPAIEQAKTTFFITTIADKIVHELKENEKLNIQELSNNLSITKEEIEKWVKILEQEKTIEVNYPTNFMSPPIIKLLKKNKDQKTTYELPKEKKIVTEYNITADNVLASVKIWDVSTENVFLYEVIMPELDIGTEALVCNFIDKLAAIIKVESDEITDPKKIHELSAKFLKSIEIYLKKELPETAQNTLNSLAGIILHRMFGLGEIEVMLSDDFVEEFTINGSTEPISLFHKKQGWCKTTKYLGGEEEIHNFSAQIGRKIGRDINSLNPIMDAHLLSGDRVAATLFPISSRGNTITIRRFARNPWTIISLLDPKVNTISKEVASILWLAMQYELNFLVAGGTASGKTSMLNSLCSFIPPNQRIISIEDTREIMLPKDLHWNWVPLTSRNANPDGEGEVTMLDLMMAALRMRPDRIIVGEVRRREQAEAMFEAMHTGHSVYSTFHADTALQVKRRLTEPPINIPQTEVEALHLVLMQYRDRRRGGRRSLELAEVVGGENSLELNYLYRWRPRTDTFEKVNESVRIFEDLNLHTGMTIKEINEDLKMKQKILQWMLDNKITDMDDVGSVMKLYYKKQEIVEDAAQKNQSPGKIMEWNPKK